MTEQHAAEAATIEAMHTGWAAPDLEYTYDAPRLDLVPVRADELARLRMECDRLRMINERLGQESVTNLTLIANLRAQITDLHCDYSGQIATLELRVRELDAWIAAVPTGALIDYFYGSDARNFDAREGQPIVESWICRIEDENAGALRGQVRP